MKHNFDEVVKRLGTGCKKWDTYDKDVIPMWIADTDFTCPKPIVDAIRKRAEHEVYGYPIIESSYERAVAGWQRRRFGWNIKTDWVEYTPAVIPAIVYAMRAFTHPGDRVVVQMPCYHPFPEVIPHNGRFVAPNPLIPQKDGSWAIDWKGFEELLKDPRTTMFLLCNPHNPTGKVFTKAELTRMANLCAKYGVFVVSDEIHSDIVYKGSKHYPFGSVSDVAAKNCVVCVNPSKTFNIAGFRTGAAIIPDKHNHELFRNEVENLKAFGRNIFGTLAVEVAYTKCDYYADQEIEYLQGNLDYLRKFLEEKVPEMKVGKVQATYLIWIDCKALKMDNKTMMDFFLHKAKVAMNDGATFGLGGEGYMRMNIACPRSQLEEALKRIEKAVKTLRK
jgi:cystathionine beta-lyase